MRWHLTIATALMCGVLLAGGCGGSGGQLRGLQHDRYVSTTRPSVSLAAKSLPLLTGGEGRGRLVRSGVIGGLPFRSWYAIYGTPAKGPLAIVAHGELPVQWIWDGDMRRPFSINVGTEVFGGEGFQAFTYIAETERDPFVRLTNPQTLQQEDAVPQRWIVRTFAKRCNFDIGKIVMEYREVLPNDIVSLTALPYGRADYVSRFEQRAREAFSVQAPQIDAGNIEKHYVGDAILWQYMNEAFWGTASYNDTFRDD